MTPKFVQACKCIENNRVHSYCKAAHIIQKKRISCDKCGQHYEFSLSKKNISMVGMLCASFLQSLFVYLLIYVAFLF